MEKKLKKLFDYQRFEKNPDLEKLIREASPGKVMLSDDDVDGLNAAGLSTPTNLDALRTYEGSSAEFKYLKLGINDGMNPDITSSQKKL